MSDTRPPAVSDNTLNALESLYSPNGARLFDLDVVDVVRELRKLREENAKLNEQLGASEEKVHILRADLSRQEDICTRSHWSKPAPPEVK